MTILELISSFLLRKKFGMPGQASTPNWRCMLSGVYGWKEMGRLLQLLAPMIHKETQKNSILLSLAKNGHVLSAKSHSKYLLWLLLHCDGCAWYIGNGMSEVVRLHHRIILP